MPSFGNSCRSRWNSRSPLTRSARRVRAASCARRVTSESFMSVQASMIMAICHSWLRLGKDSSTIPPTFEHWLELGVGNVFQLRQCDAIERSAEQQVHATSVPFDPVPHLVRIYDAKLLSKGCRQTRNVHCRAMRILE